MFRSGPAPKSAARSKSCRTIGTEWLGLVLTLLAGCASPTAKLQHEAQQYGFEFLQLPGEGFVHGAYAHGSDTSRLHVYIDGDGRPWLSRHRISPDPNPRNPVALRMMAKDAARSLYLGRACYFDHFREPPCSPLEWTLKRYSEANVNSMAAALENFLRERPASEVTFIGYSGGGTLAWLLASRFPNETRAVITVAANLDVDAWADAHGYTRLEGSLNPAAMPPLDRRIAQVHLLGADDINVTADQLRRFLDSNRHAELRVIDGVDHGCCWVDRWPRLLGDIQHRLSRQPRDKHHHNRTETAERLPVAVLKIGWVKERNPAFPSQ